MKCMIRSILDSDLYKFTMQQAVLELYPDAVVSYDFTSRKSAPINDAFVEALIEQIHLMKDLKLTALEKRDLSNSCLYFKPGYLAYLENYSFDPNEVTIGWTNEDHTDLKNLKITVNGPWHRTILWEVPLLALVSECYFKYVDINWNYDFQVERINSKGKNLDDAGCRYADFGTRRRRSFAAQELVVQNLVNYKGFQGTSNVMLALKYGVKSIGTMAHEWTMGVSGLESLAHANRFALENWIKVYNGKLGIALTDTFGTEAFLEDFQGNLAKTYDGVRHDSGCPVTFANRVCNFYNKQNILIKGKMITFSDGLDVKSAVELQAHCDLNLGIICFFGIGTHLTNDFTKADDPDAVSPALNIVMKLRTIQRNRLSSIVQLVKLSDVSSKATGDKDAIRIAKNVFFGIPLDAEKGE